VFHLFRVYVLDADLLGETALLVKHLGCGRLIGEGCETDMRTIYLGSERVPHLCAFLDG
jgi:hypothetical protein